MLFRFGDILIPLQCRRLAAALLLMLSLISGASPLFAADIKASEKEVKTAYIYNLFQFTQWPDDARSDWNICLFPDDPLYAQLSKLNGKITADRNIRVLRTSSPDSWRQCHILIVPPDISATQKKQVYALRETPVLTITDGESRQAPHAIMFFYREETHIRMGVHYPRLKTSGISISARLLKILKVRDLQGGLKP